MSPHRTSPIRALLTGLLLGLAVLATAAALPGPALAQQTGVAPRDGGARDSGRNPTADSVNEEALFKGGGSIRGTVTIPDRQASTLVQPQGRDWRGFHERWLPWIGGIAVLGMLLGLVIFYFAKGRIGAHDEVSGQKILRFNAFERFAHWLSAACFIVLAITGLNYIFGKRLLQPLLGPDAFATWSQWAKYAHNFLAWPFMLGIALLFVLWVKDNIPNRIDWAWIRCGGGLFRECHAHSERFNAGQKGVFWIVIIGGVLMSVTGIVLLFPFSWADVNGMQLASVVHAVIGVLFIAAMLAHIYIGSLGMSGAYDAMSTGEVDLAWAKRHHDLWVEKEQAKTASGPQLGARAAPAE